MKDYYQILDLPLDAAPEKIKEQYRFLVHAWHPDKFPNADQKAKAQDKIKEVNEAYKVLSDPAKRKQYDRDQVTARIKKEEHERQKVWAEYERQQQGRAADERQQRAQAERARPPAEAAHPPKDPAEVTRPTAEAKPRPAKTKTAKKQTGASQAKILWSGLGLVVVGLGLGLWGLYSLKIITWGLAATPLETPANAVTQDPAAGPPTNTPVILTPRVVVPTPTPGLPAQVRAIAVGTDTTCALMSDGQVKCWGLKVFAPAEQGSITGYDLPKRVDWLDNVTAVAVAPHHVCGIAAQGAVICGGYDLGLGNLTGPKFGVKTLTEFANGNVAIAASPDPAGPTCTLTQGGDIQCLGWLFDKPQYLAGFSNIQAIAVGGFHVCGLSTSGGVKCWGSNTQGELGNGTFTTSRNNRVVDVLGLEQGVSAIVAGKDHTCALTTAQRVVCWGSNAHGQLGDGSIIDQNTPVVVKGLTEVKALAAGAWHTCALLAAGSVQCWGENSDGRLGDGTLINHNTIVDAAGLSSGVATIAAGGGEHTCALLVTGEVKCWGESVYGEVGDGSPSKGWVTIPTEVVGLNR